MIARPRASVLLATAALVALSGCGGTAEDTDAGGATSSPPASASASPTDEPSPSEAESSPAEEPSETEQQEPAAITISGFEFDTPESVAPGQTITVTNEDEALHTVTAEGDGGFDVEVDGGATAELTAPEEPGQYPFFCTPHPYMTSTLVVE